MKITQTYKLATIAAVSVAVILTLLNQTGIISLNPVIVSVVRWVAILMGAYICYRKNSLTTWILFSMVVGAAIAYTVGHMGFGILANLFKLLATLYAALAAFLLLVLLPIALFVKVPIKKFISAIAEPVSIAFATTSSEAALPKALEQMEKFGVPRKILAFVLPTGYSFNLDGSTLYLSLATIFVAQAANIEIPIGQQILIMLTLMLISKQKAWRAYHGHRW